MRTMITAIASVAVWSAAMTMARAQDVESFYKNQTLKIIVGSGAGGSYDLYGRALSRFMSRHLPGHPTIIVQNMPGGGGYAAVNHLYNNAPRDGTVIATFSRSVPMQPLVDNTGVHFDPRKLEWIGSPSDEVGVTLSSAAGPVKSVEDLKNRGMLVAATGPGTDSNVYARVLGNVLGYKIKLVTGYTGSPDMLLAVVRGEAEGAAGISFSSLWPAHKDLIENKKLNLLLQLGLRPSKAPQLAHAPLAIDQAKTPEDRQLLEVIFARQTMAFPFTAPPGVPADRLKALRDAFNATVTDPDFVAEANKIGMNVQLITWQEMTDIMNRVYSTPPELVARLKTAMETEN